MNYETIDDLRHDYQLLGAACVQLQHAHDPAIVAMIEAEHARLEKAINRHPDRVLPEPVE